MAAAPVIRDEGGTGEKVTPFAGAMMGFGVGLIVGVLLAEAYNAPVIAAWKALLYREMRKP